MGNRRQFNVVQKRGDTEVGVGRVTVYSEGTISWGEYDSPETVQWNINDYILLADSPSGPANSMWDLGDSQKVGVTDYMFDGTIQRFPQGRISDLTLALNTGKLQCPQGICISFSENHQAFYLICRSDKKEEGLRFFKRLAEQYPDRGFDGFPRSRAAALKEKRIPAEAIRPLAQSPPQSRPQSLPQRSAQRSAQPAPKPESVCDRLQ